MIQIYRFYQQSIQFEKMSFFEKMIKINNKMHEREKVEEAYYEEETTSNDQKDEIKVDRSKLKLAKFSKTSSVSNSRYNEEDKGWEQICDEPKIQQVNKSQKPSLIMKMLPKNEQLLRDMLVRKKQFEEKLANSKIKREEDIKHKIMYSSVKCQQPLKQSKPSLGISRKQSHTKGSLEKSAYQPPILKESTVSYNLENYPPKHVNDSFGKEVMMRLISLLQNERCDRNNFFKINHDQTITKPEDKMPIVINNIMKSPTQSLNRDLMEQQMKIRMLQNNRKLSTQNRYRESSKKSQQKQKQQCKRYGEDNSLHTRRTTNINLPEFQAFLLSDNRLLKNNEISQPFQSVQNRANHQNVEGACNNLSEKISQKDKQKIDQNQQSRNVNSNFSSRIQQKQNKPPRKRQFQNNKNRKQPNQSKPTSNEQSLPIKQELNPKSAQQNNFSVKSSNTEKQIFKQSVLFEIQLDKNSDTKGLSLAEAFKRKVGKLKSERDREKYISAQKNDTFRNGSMCLTQHFTQSNAVSTISIKLTPLQSTSKLNLNNIKPSSCKNKHVLNSAKTTLSKQQVGKENRDKSLSREPSKDLIDRLIYGQRAKVTKKQMYALTRKNYQNLPQVQAKKKEEQKKAKEQQRLAKIKDYHHSIRSNKSKKSMIQ